MTRLCPGRGHHLTDVDSDTEQPEDSQNDQQPDSKPEPVRCVTHEVVPFEAARQREGSRRRARAAGLPGTDGPGELDEVLLVILDP